VEVLSPEQAQDYLAGGGSDPIRVSGRLDLTKLKLDRLPSGLHCYELDLSGTEIAELPHLEVECRLTLDNCRQLHRLPEGLRVGSLSLRNCPSLHALPEGLDVWFLDLSESLRFHQWPQNGRIHGGQLNLRNCIGIHDLPDWLTTLSQLDVAGCILLHSLPEHLAVRSWIDVGGSGLQSLPDSLRKVSLRWRGVRIDERIAFSPDDITAREALAQPNAEIRRVMIERMGYLKFANEAGAKVLDEDRDAGGKRQLLKIDLEEDEALVGLSCSCPSTSRQYFLRVPPKTKTCHQAAAWIAGFDDPSRYKPALET
jgi:hypothetical protein